jgi:hypothetical protein
MKIMSKTISCQQQHARWVKLHGRYGLRGMGREMSNKTISVNIFLYCHLSYKALTKNIALYHFVNVLTMALGGRS